MTLPAALFAVRWLIRDTFRQSLANGIFWLMLAVSGLCFAVCLSVTIEREEMDPPAHGAERISRSDVDKVKNMKPEERPASPQGEVGLAFGAIRIPWTHSRDSAVRFLQMILLGLVADTGGILLALVWTAGFLPSFLEPANASVLLAKPVPRWSLLAGKVLGVLIFVAFQALVFVGGVWLGLGLGTGVWDGTCFLAVPVLLVHFFVFFSFSALLAVTTRSTVACVFGSVVFWLLCLGMNLGRHSVYNLSEMQDLPQSFRALVDAGYWILPKPADLGRLLVDALHAGKDFAPTFTVPEH